MWGIWNGLSARDSEATRRVGALLRFIAPFLTSPDWEPHVVLNIPQQQPAAVFASRWPAAAGAPYAHNATAWTLVNRGAANVSASPLVFVPCAGAAVYDLYAGVALTPEPVAGGGCAVSVGVEAGGFGAVLALDPADVDAALTAFLARMAAMTAAALASYATSPVLLQQAMTVWEQTTPAPQPPPGMKAVAGATAWVFAVDGTEIEGGSTPGTDVRRGEAAAGGAGSPQRVPPLPAAVAGPVPLGVDGLPSPWPDEHLRRRALRRHDPRDERGLRGLPQRVRLRAR